MARRVEQCASAIEGVDDVVDRAALLFLSMRRAEIHPVASVHGVTCVWIPALVAFLLERREPWR